MHFAPEGAVFVVFTEGGGQAGHIVRVDRSGSPLSAAQSSSPRYPQVGFEYAGTDVYAAVYDPGHYTVYWSNGSTSVAEAKRCRRKSPSAATGACASTLTGARKRLLSSRN